ncbi:putative protein FAM19A5 [Triplophysa rosa]|uniref:Uncharacterized protein n=1 Tax=Triplophysa rosa TaxID=992332 RepID=A0A9W7W7I8_TRIRA|nr:putative protein FAM19A5 [Triplophysa rosa]
MASAVRSIKRKDAINWPRMSTTFWAVLLLTALLIVYCDGLPTTQQLCLSCCQDFRLTPPSSSWSYLYR